MIWDIFTSTSDSAHTLAWSYYFHNSPYSPLFLTHLRPPMPQGAPADTPADTFSFADAFEDLLAVSANQDMLPVQTRIDMRAMMRRVFPQGEPPAFWLQRLNAAGLLQPNSRTFLLPDEYDAHHLPDQRAPGGGSGPLDHADAFAREFTRFLDDTQTASADALKKAETSLEELAGQWTSAFETGTKSFSSWVDMLRAGDFDLSANTSSKNSAAVSETLSDDGKLKTVESKDEYIDWMGMLHSKTTVKTVDENGRVVSSKSHWNVTNHYDKEKYKHLAKDGGDKDKKKSDW